jgi:flagellar FliL protein
MLDKIVKILNAISQTILIIVAFVSLFTAYILFAPDELPKPFHMVYDYGNATSSQPVADASEVAAAPATALPEPHTFLPGEGVMVNMSTKIINLMDPSGRKYIRLTLVVEFAPDNPEYESLPEEEKTAYLTSFQEKLNSRLPIMDDTVITLLSTKTYEDLYTADGKEKLRMEIMDTLSKKLADLHIISIYFTEFVVQ